MRMEGTSAAQRVELWADALLDVLLPVQAEPGTPVLLACDDETIRTAADRIGADAADPSRRFAADVALAFDVGRIAGWKRVVADGWRAGSRPRPRPPFFPVLCLWVLAASRMAPDERHPTNEYHGRLCDLIGVSGDDSLPCFNFIGPRFHDLGDWFEHDLEGTRGALLVPDSPHPQHVGYAVAQTVLRLRDRQVLAQFFSERLPTLDGFDPLRRLRRWGGRHQLTGHAQQLVEDDGVADRVRAAIRAAFRGSAGAELVRTATGFGRVWPSASSSPRNTRTSHCSVQPKLN